MKWYDIFASIYDYSVELVYRPYRPRIVRALQLNPDDAVLDLACGTGRNHPYLQDALSEHGMVFGVDFSEGMLNKAQRQATQQDWRNVHLIHHDARTLEKSRLCEAANRDIGLQAVLVTLGLSVVPDWKTVLEHTFELLEPGGRYVIFDIYAERWVPQSWVVKHLAQADLYRQSWSVLETLSDDFSFEFLPGSPHIHGGRPFLASGRKPS